MKKLLFLMVLITVLSVSSMALTVYTYESMAWIEEEAIGIFEDKYGIDVNVIKLGDGGNVLSRLLLEKRNPRADVVIGLDQSLAVKAIEEDVLEAYTPSNVSNISKSEYIFDSTGNVYPYDYGAIAIIYDPMRLDNVPVSFEDLKNYKNSLVIQDPRSSSTGQAFLLWTIAVYGENWKDFWKGLKPAILTVTSGWSEAFSKFEAGEAPMMVSYATDGAYSYHYYESTQYKAFIPEDGAYIQIEGAGIVKNTKNREDAEKFMDFLLTEDFQDKIALNQWMFPVVDVTLPEAFKYAVVPEKLVTLDAKTIGENMETWLSEWEEIMY